MTEKLLTGTLSLKTNNQPTVQETNYFTDVGWLKKMKCMVMYQYPTCDMHFVQRKRCVEYWAFFRNSLHFKRQHILQMFFFNLVEHKVSLFTNKQEFLTLFHLRSFRQFQNLSEETWNRVAENLIELCFVAFLSNRSKTCFILV